MILVDSNVLLDILTEDPKWFEWSSKAITDGLNTSVLAINPLIYAEVSIRFESLAELDETLPESDFRREPLPYAAAFLAGKAHLHYRRRGGLRTSPLPDFYIGAHAAVCGLRILTRDANRYRTYFPRVSLIAP